MDGRIHRAFPRKRYKEQQTVLANTYSQGSSERSGTASAPPHSHYLFSILFKHMITCGFFHRFMFTSSPPFVIGLAPLCVYSCLTAESLTHPPLPFFPSSLLLLPLLCNQFSSFPFMILFHSYGGFQGRFLFLFPSLLLSVLYKLTAREQLVLCKTRSFFYFRCVYVVFVPGGLCF